MRKLHLENFTASNNYFIWQNLSFKFVLVSYFKMEKKTNK